MRRMKVVRVTKTEFELDDGTITTDMARALDIERPYVNLRSYLEYKKKGIDRLREKEDLIKKI